MLVLFSRSKYLQKHLPSGFPRCYDKFLDTPKQNACNSCGAETITVRCCPPSFALNLDTCPEIRSCFTPHSAARSERRSTQYFLSMMSPLETATDLRRRESMRMGNIRIMLSSRSDLWAKTAQVGTACSCPRSRC